MSAPAFSETYFVTRLAGTMGRAGYQDGNAATAQFSSMDAVAVDIAKNVYVADTGNHVIRKITPAGIVTTLAGQASRHGSDDGARSTALFYYPHGIAIDGAGNLYIADSWNHTIRKMTPQGTVITVAGLAGSRGNRDGVGEHARFSFPFGIAIDHDGHMYVADEKNCAIRRITPAGDVTTVAGRATSCGNTDGSSRDARFNEPRGVAVDRSGNIFVADTYNHTIRRITPDGWVTTVAGLARWRGHADGPARTARFYNPLGVAVDGSGSVYVADTYNHTIREITPRGMVRTVAGMARTPGGRDANAAAARFNSPIGLAIDGDGDIYVADYHNHAIRKITRSGRDDPRPPAALGIGAPTRGPGFRAASQER